MGALRSAPASIRNYPILSQRPYRRSHPKLAASQRLAVHVHQSRFNCKSTANGNTHMAHWSPSTSKFYKLSLEVSSPILRDKNVNHRGRDGENMRPHITCLSFQHHPKMSLYSTPIRLNQDTRRSALHALHAWFYTSWGFPSTSVSSLLKKVLAGANRCPAKPVWRMEPISLSLSKTWLRVVAIV